MPAHHETDPQFDALGAAISDRTPPPVKQIEARVAAALAECDALEINPLCSTEHAEKLIRQDARRIVAANPLRGTTYDNPKWTHGAALSQHKSTALPNLRRPAVHAVCRRRDVQPMQRYGKMARQI